MMPDPVKLFIICYGAVFLIETNRQRWVDRWILSVTVSDIFTNWKNFAVAGMSLSNYFHIGAFGLFYASTVFIHTASYKNMAINIFLFPRKDEKGNWQSIEKYIRDRSEAFFSHGICSECANKLYPELFSAEQETFVKIPDSL